MHLPSVQALLKKYEIRPKKRFGQNFLHAQPTMEKIVAAVRINADDHVVEIGFGLGLMTASVAARCARVVAIDADRQMFEIARAEFGALTNVTWLNEDVLKVFGIALRGGRDLVVVGNIPYNISSPIFFHLVDHRASIARAILLIQREVAERITAKPGGKEYGALTVMLQAHARCTKLFKVAPSNFIPPPDVESAVIELDFASMRAAAPLPPLFAAVVRGAFQHRRKTLRNALLGATSLSIDPADLDRILARLAIDPRRRPETLSVQEFQVLAHEISLIIK